MDLAAELAQRAQPLQERKTTLTQAMTTEAPAIAVQVPSSEAPATKTTKRQLTGPARKCTSMKIHYEPTQAEIAAFQDLQNAFKAPTFLMHFDRKRKLYVDIDASKVWGFAAMVYHVRNEAATPARVDVQAIMFLSKSINTAERNYCYIIQIRRKICSR